MHVPKQNPPVPRNQRFRQRQPPSPGVVPSSCPDGTLIVTCPDGTQTSFTNTVACCYDGWDCNPCSDNSRYCDIANQLSCCQDKCEGACVLTQVCTGGM